MSPLRPISANCGDPRLRAAVAETSYYAPLANLLNEIGKTLKPKVRCVINSRTGAPASPTAACSPRSSSKKLPTQRHSPASCPRAAPSRSSPRATTPGSRRTASRCSATWSDTPGARHQLARLRARRPGRRRARSAKLETCRLADGRAEILGRQPPTRAPGRRQARGEGLTEYLKRVMLHAAPLAEPKDVAWFLASYARDARLRLEQQTTCPRWRRSATALEEALGLKFEGEKGEHFFRSTLVQTLFYGVFSAWVLWSKQHPAGPTRPASSGTRPLVPARPHDRRALRPVRHPAKLGPLNLAEVLDWAGEALNRVDRAAFFEQVRGRARGPVLLRAVPGGVRPGAAQGAGRLVHPAEIVQYMVARVDTRAARGTRHRRRPGRPERLRARPVLRHRRVPGRGAASASRQTLQAKGADAWSAQDVKRAAHEARLRLRDPARAVRGRAPAARLAAPESRRAALDDR